MQRRNFLKTIGGIATVAFGVPGCRARYDRLFDLEEDFRDIIPVSENYINSICQLCPAGCGIQARVINGNIVSIKGNPLSPVNKGKVCHRGAAGTQHIYSPHRIKHPMILDGNKGSGKYREIGWDDALKMIADRLRKLKENGETQKVVLLSGNQQGLLDRLFKNFLTVYGSPNYVKIEPDAGMRMVIKLMHGTEGRIGYDLENSNYILNFGINLFESSASPVWHNWVYGYLRRVRQGRRAKLVHIDPMASISAIKSDEWIGIRPGTGGALALGIANILVNRDLYNSEFVKSSTFGFEDWTDANGIRHKGFKSLLIEKYDPRGVSDITGVPVRDIDRIAREFAANQPSIAIFDDNTAQYYGGIFSQMAIHSLNALVGNIDSTGGIFEREGIPYTDWPVIPKDDQASHGVSHQRIDQAQSARFPMAESIPPNLLLGQEDNKIDTLFITNCSPMSLFSNPGKYEKLLTDVPFVVSCASHHNETTPFCDLVLPIPTYLEKWEDIPSGAQTGFNQVLGLMKPVISPPYNTKSIGDIFLHIAKDLGPPVSDALPWDSFEDLLRHSLEGIFSSQSGMIFSGTFERSWLDSMEKSGWRLPFPLAFDEFWDQIVGSGGWWNPKSPEKRSKNQYKTPSKKFEFYSQTLLQYFSKYYKEAKNPQQLTGIIQKVIGTHAVDDEIFMPHYELPQLSEDASDYPLVLFTFETGALRDGSINSQPILMEVLNAYGGEKWDSWAEVNPETAQQFDLYHNNEIWIESSNGKIKTKIKISERIVPGVVSLPLGLGHKENPDSDISVGVNPNSIIVTNIDPLSGIDAKNGTRVKVYRA